MKVHVETTCKLEPISVYQVIPAATDTVVEDATTYTGEKCTCESCVYKAGGVPHDDIGRVDQKWCKCAQTGTKLGLDVENYALLGPVCAEYPTVGMDSSCQINNNNNTFPKVINCKSVVVLFRGVDVTLETEVASAAVSLATCATPRTRSQKSCQCVSVSRETQPCP